MIIRVNVKTGQKKFYVEKGDVWNISVKSPPERGMANAEIIRELSKLYEDTRILKGIKSKKKLIRLGNRKS